MIMIFIAIPESAATTTAGYLPGITNVICVRPVFTVFCKY